MLVAGLAYGATLMGENKQKNKQTKKQGTTDQNHMELRRRVRFDRNVFHFVIGTGTTINFDLIDFAHIS